MKIYGKIFGPKEKLRYGIEEWERPGNYYKIGDIKDGGYVRGYYVSGCSGKATQLLDPDYEFLTSNLKYPPITDTMSWGYHGRGSDLLAGWLIMEGLKPGFPETTSGYAPRERAIMLRHYKAFSEEVVANLPDEWEMDTDWIKAWVMERENKLEVV